MNMIRQLFFCVMIGMATVGNMVGHHYQNRYRKHVFYDCDYPQSEWQEKLKIPKTFPCVSQEKTKEPIPLDSVIYSLYFVCAVYAYPNKNGWVSHSYYYDNGNMLKMNFYKYDGKHVNLHTIKFDLKNNKEVCNSFERAF